MSYNPRFCRRRFLQALGLSSAFLPLLGHDSALGNVSGYPKRLAILVWPNGVTNEFWPSGAGTAFELSEPLASLAPHKQDIIICDDIHTAAMRDQYPHYGGHASLGYLLTGAHGKFHFNGEDSAIGDAISVDQFIANERQKSSATPIHSLVMGLDSREERKPDQRYVSFRGPAIGGQPDAAETLDDVHDVYSRLFSAASMPTEMVDRVRQEQKSLLDYVGRDLQRFSANLGVESRQKIEKHLDSIREVERGLDAVAGPSDYEPFEIDSSVDSFSKEQYDRVARIQLQLTTGALATGNTHVATMLWSNGHNNAWVFRWLGEEFSQPGDGGFNPLRSHHEIAHRGGSGGSGDDARRKRLVDGWFVSQFADLIAQFKAVEEGDGTMLDNSVIVMANNMGNGASHSNVRVPWMLAGSCGGYFKTGQYLRPGEETPNNAILVALARAMGVDIDTFGEEKFGGELAGLKA